MSERGLGGEKTKLSRKRSREMRKLSRERSKEIRVKSHEEV